MIDTYMKAVKAAGEKYAAENGVLDFDEVVEEKPENVGGKFAISYTILGVNCKELKNVLMNAKQKGSIEYATMKCGGQEIVL
ncbi:hypothetical protein COOONC_07732 [Cooperia oncophora]